MAADSPTSVRAGAASVRAVTFELFRDLGLTTVFGNPGSTELPMLQEFPEDFSYVLGLQEATVVAMADGFARGTGRAALVNLHTAAGLGNAVGSLVAAYHGRAPLVVTAGQQDRGQLEAEPFLSGPLVEIARPYVKWAHEPARPQDVPAALERAHHTAMQPPRGPAFVSIPMDDWAAPGLPHRRREVSGRTGPDPAALERLAGVLAEAERPAVVAGADVDAAGARDALVALAERLRAAVWAEPYGTLAGFPQRHPLFQGFLPFAQLPLCEALRPYDVVLVVGAPVFLYYPFVPGPTVPEGTRVLHLTADPSEAARALEGFSVVGDVALAVRGLLDLVPESRRAAPSAPSPPPRPELADPPSAEWVYATLAERMPADAAFFEEAPSTKEAQHTYLRLDAPGGYHTTASGGLGWAMPAAVGFALASPGRPVVCVVGEGSAMYAVQSLWSAAAYGAAVCFVVLNNSQYAILKGFGELLQLAPPVPGLEVGGLDVVSLARGFGCEARRIERPTELGEAFERALGSGRPALLEVPIAPKLPKLA